ncbi:MAG TPA: Asp-tRNA(Asn)/Glu-tRNA(Gln) amidotransferase subunit GatA [Gemmatimonadaceae bacterium]
MTPGELSVSGLSEAVQQGTQSAHAAFDAAFATADRVGASSRDGLNILLSSDANDARGQADDVAERLRNRALQPLGGVPVVLKDNIATTNLPTSCASRILEGYVSPFEATAVTRLRNAGAIIVGKSNMDEFAMGSSTENSAFGVTRNPLDPTRVPGGSSGGSAAAVAAGIVRLALGSETGGSVRQPAAFCGVVGVKPTYGRVSRFGLVAFASSLDQIGVFGKTVDDAARGLEVIAGGDPRDSTSAWDQPVPLYSDAASGAMTGVVIGKPKEYFPDHLDPRIRAKCEASLEKLKALGAEVRDVSLPHTNLAIEVYYIVAPAEASANLSRFDGVRYGLRANGEGLRGMYEATRSNGFGPEVTRRILLGTYVLSAGYYDAYYRKAQQVRALIAKDFADVFNSGVHLLFTPTTPTPAFPIGSKSDPYEMYLSDIFTVTANLAGLPAMSLPIGRVGGLPVGGQFLANHFDERQMFAAAYTLERALGDEAHT